MDAPVAAASWKLPALGLLTAAEGWSELSATSDGYFSTGTSGVRRIVRPRDGKVEFVDLGGRTLAHVVSSLGYPAYYPVPEVRLESPVRAVLMDLDGTSVHSEHFWIWIIEQTVASVLGDRGFRLVPEDLPHVSGHSVSEHLQYCLLRYAPSISLETARKVYFQLTHREMEAILRGAGRPGAFAPAPGLKEFLLELKRRGIRIGLVTSGLYEKAWPEIVSAFEALGLGAPEKFYDAIITAGQALRPGQAGTIGELAPKPHPWLYAETARVGLGIPPSQRHQVLGLEDSGAGVVALRLAGFSAVGIAGGNIAASGVAQLCSHTCADLGSVLPLLE